MRTKIRTLKKFCMAVIVLLTLLGCQPRPVVPTPTLLATSTLHSLAATPTPTPTTAAMTATPTSTPDLLTATASASPTPTGCPRPSNWVEHIIRADETLYYLATSTGVDVEDVIKANCLASDILVVGDPIYLPSNPPPRPTFPPPPPTVPPPPPPPPAPTACPSPFSCSQAGLPPLLIDAGAPGGPGFDPCHGTLNKAWLDVYNNIMHIGNRLYVYACEFPEGLPLTAKVELPDKTVQEVKVLPVPPNPDGEKGDAMGVVEWPALPGQAAGWYKLTVAPTEGTGVTLPFHVDPPDKEYVLVVPEVGPPGTVFEVYYINFETNPKNPLDVALYGEDQPVEKQQHNMTGRYLFKVPIDQDLPYPNGKGWTKQSIQSIPDDPLGGYSVVLNYHDLSFKQLFWLSEP